jgi:TadE-like protein
MRPVRASRRFRGTSVADPLLPSKRMYSGRNRQKGAVIAEFAIGSVVFLMSTIAIFDFGRMYHYQSRLKFAVSQATRFATTGNTLEDPDHPGTQLSRADSIVAMIRQLSRFDIPDGDIDVEATSSSGAVVAGAGGPGDIVTVTAHYQVRVIAPYLSVLFPDGEFHCSATTTFKNEEFPAQARAPLALVEAFA